MSDFSSRMRRSRHWEEASASSLRRYNAILGRECPPTGEPINANCGFRIKCCDSTGDWKKVR